MLILIMAVTLVLRLIWIFSINHRGFDTDFWIDDARALELFHDGTFSFHGVKTAFFPVGYPFFLSLLYHVFDPSLLVAKIANAILGSILCLLAALVAKTIFDNRSGVIAGWIMAFYPNNIFYSSLVLSETLFAALLALAILLVLSDKPQPSVLIPTGIMVGLCILVRAVAVILPVCILLYWIFIEKIKLMKLMSRFLLLIIGVTAVVAPWTIRNYRVMHHFVLVSTNGGVNFWMAHTYGGYTEAPKRFSANWGFAASSPEQEVIAEKKAYRETFEYLRKDPWEPMRSFPKKLIRFYYADIDGLLNNSGFPIVTSISTLSNAIPTLPIRGSVFLKWFLYFYAQVFYILLLITATFGIIQTIRRRQGKAYFLLIVIISWTLLHTLVFFPLGRYRFPLMLLFIVFSAIFIAVFSESKTFHRKLDQ